MSRFVIALIVLVFVVAMTSAAESYDSPVEELVASPEAAASPLDYDDSSYNRVRRSPHHHHHGGHYGGHYGGGHYGGYGYGHGHYGQHHHHHGYGR